MTTVDYAVSGKTLAAFHASSAPVRVLVGPVGSGKTTACVIEAFRRVVGQPPGPDGVRRSRGLVVRQTYRQLAQTTLPSYRALLGDAFGSFSFSEPATHRLRFSLADGTRVESDVIFQALDEPDAETKLRGGEYSWSWCNEVKELPRAVLSFLLGRLGRYPAKRDGGCPWFGLWADTNSWDQDHYLQHLLEVERPEGWRLFRQPGGIIWRDDKWIANPEAENLSSLPGGSEYYLKQVPGRPHDYCRVYLANETALFLDGRAVFPEFHDAVHVTAEPFPPIPHAPVYVGVDVGLQPAATLGQRAANGRWLISSELVGHDLGIVSFADELKARLAGWYPDCPEVLVYADPAAWQRSGIDLATAGDVLSAKLGLPVRPAAATNALSERLEAVRAVLTRLVDGKPGFQLSPACPKLRRALAGGYAFKRVQVSGERYRDAPGKDEHSHVADSLQYMLLGAGEGRALRRREGTGQTVVALTQFDPMSGATTEQRLRPFDPFAGTAP